MGSSSSGANISCATIAIRTGGDNSQTDHTYTGQEQDGTGLLYYNARYYDPSLGTFLSPDTVVPDAGTVIDYNRFLYARGNPLKYYDPDGHRVKFPCPLCDRTLFDYSNQKGLADKAIDAVATVAGHGAGGQPAVAGAQADVPPVCLGGVRAWRTLPRMRL